MQFELPDIDTVLAAHDYIISEFGGRAGVPHSDYIDAALHRPLSYMSYSQACDIHLIAALLLDSLARNHAFADGNKRTALVVTLLFYGLQNYEINVSLMTNESFEQLVLDVVELHPDIQSTRSRLSVLAAEHLRVFE